MKKWLFNLLFVLACICCLSFSVYADQETGGYKLEVIEIEIEEDYAENEVSLFSEPEVPFEEFLYDALYNRKFDGAVTFDGTKYKSIEVDKYNIHHNDLVDVYEKLVHENPELMLYPNGVIVAYIRQTGKATDIVPNYIFDNKYDSNDEYAKMEKWIDNFVSLVDKNLSDEEKLLKAYYFVADNVGYSLPALMEQSIMHTAYGAYRFKMCVCEGYASLMCDILEKLGIECGVVPTSDELDDSDAHIWNYVVLDGEYYHLDITWDDLDFSDAKLKYENFLVSDKKRDANMRENSTYSKYSKEMRLWRYFDGDKVCDSDKYESGYIWNFRGLMKNITECSRGWKGNIFVNVRENYTTKFSGMVPFVFETIKVPSDEFIMSEITSNYLFFINDLKKLTDTTLYLAEYDKNDRVQKVTGKNFYGMKPANSELSYITVTKPNAHKVNIMWLNSKTLAPLGRNVIME